MDDRKKYGLFVSFYLVCVTVASILAGTPANAGNVWAVCSPLTGLIAAQGIYIFRHDYFLSVL